MTTTYRNLASSLFGFFGLSLKNEFTRRVGDNVHEYAGSLLTGWLMNISAKGLEEDKNHFGVFLRFLLHRPENMFINRDYDNFISADVRQMLNG